MAAGAALFALASAVFGSVVVLGVLALRSGLPSLSILATRFALAFLLLGGMLLVLRRPLVAAPGERLWLILLGVGGYATDVILFYAALERGTAAAVSLLFFTYPLLVAVVSIFLGRVQPGWLLVGALALTFLGSFMLISLGEGLVISWTGALLAIGSALSVAAQLLIAERVLRQTHSLTGSLWVLGAACLALIALSLATQQWHAPAGWEQWGPILGMGVGTALAFVCMLAGLRRVGAIRAAMIHTSQPFATAVLAVLFLGEVLDPPTVAGGLLVIAGVTCASVARLAPAESPVAKGP